MVCNRLIDAVDGKIIYQPFHLQKIKANRLSNRMTEEIIARKKNVGWMYKVLIAFGIILIVLSLILIEKLKYTAILYIIAAVVLVAVCGVINFRIAKTPSVVITRRGDELILPDTTVKISQITNVISRCGHWKGVSFSWGDIVLTVNGSELKYKYIQDVESVQRRLTELMLSKRSSSSD